jgi:hypothetical protein
MLLHCFCSFVNHAFAILSTILHLPAILCTAGQLLGGILEVNSGYVSEVERLQLSHCFFEFLRLEHPNNNVHNIKLCRQLMISGSLSHEQLLELAAADKARNGCGELCAFQACMYLHTKSNTHACGEAYSSQGYMHQSNERVQSLVLS